MRMLCCSSIRSRTSIALFVFRYLYISMHVSTELRVDNEIARNAECHAIQARVPTGFMSRYYRHNQSLALNHSICPIVASSRFNPDPLHSPSRSPSVRVFKHGDGPSPERYDDQPTSTSLPHLCGTFVFCADNNTGENWELRQQLNSEYRDKRADAIKRVIANHTIGKDCSGLFPDVVKNMVRARLDILPGFVALTWTANGGSGAEEAGVPVLDELRKDTT